jgi:DNA-binding SARP family transcriptional activator
MHAEITRTVMLNLLFSFTLMQDWRPVPLIASAQRLVAFLALRERPPSRAHVAGVLWPETSTERANANLRSSLWRLQKACAQLVVASPQQLALAPEVVVDVRTAVAGAHRMLDEADPCEDLLSLQMLSALSADLLADWYDDDWVVAYREQYHQLRIHALEAMCERLTAARRYGDAVQAGLAAVRAEPLRESAHHALVKAHLAEGNRFEATRQYRSCRRLLWSELGVEPSPTLQALLTDAVGASAHQPPASGRKLANTRDG